MQISKFLQLKTKDMHIQMHLNSFIYGTFPKAHPSCGFHHNSFSFFRHIQTVLCLCGLPYLCVGNAYHRVGCERDIRSRSDTGESCGIYAPVSQ
ncbi:hypothetical protein PSENEW3_00003192 [Picochlorum sp. SENEW3]|nr:hypothetical protein PSENEW3_00003192 [Picochlorum sp. SENEW3]